MEGQMTFEFAKRPTIKGYPELRWTGKRPYESTQYYPAQLRERYGEETNGWINKIFWGDNLQVMKTMVDRFGEDVTTLAYDMTSFRVQTEVSASPTFFGWVFGFNGKVQILAPERVKEQYRQMIAKADENMQESE